MTTPAHTPGPWAVGNQNAPIPSSIAVVTQADGLRVADVHVWATMIGDQKWANARLIAAAPEMLSLLRREQNVRGQMLAALRAGSDLISGEWVALDREARALLAKIDGKE